jgi:REP element-mobilizing transposase RayT
MEIGSRLDSPGSLHHVMGRGAEGLEIFIDDQDRGRFLSRLDRILLPKGARVHAWALMPNHYHLLMQIDDQGLDVIMQRILVGYCNYFNRKHSHKGHVFMSRYKSILVDRENYLFELIRYIHLNPVRAGIVHDLSRLASYPWTGHRSLLSGPEHEWQPVNDTLLSFADSTDVARKSYLAYMEDGLVDSDSEEFETGNITLGKNGIVLECSVGADQRRYDFQGSILGSREFALKTASELEGRRRRIKGRRETHELIEQLTSTVMSHYSVSSERLFGRSRGGIVSSARKVLAKLLFQAGLSGADVARRLKITQAAVSVILGKSLEQDEQLVFDKVVDHLLDRDE